MANLEEQARDLSQMFREAADDLDKHFDHVKIARLTGNGIAAAGGIIATLGLVFAPATGGASLAAGAAGSAIAVTGGVTAGGAEVVGSVIEKKKYGQMTKLWDAFRKEMKETLDPALSVEGMVGKLGKVCMKSNKAVQLAKKISSLYKAFRPVGASQVMIKESVKAGGKGLAVLSLTLSVVDLIKVSMEIAKKTQSPVGQVLRGLAKDLDDLFKD